MKWNEYVTAEQLTALKTAAEKILRTEVRVKQNYAGDVLLIPRREMD